MPGTTNFLPINPSAANQESDAAYASDALRSGGALTNALLPSPTFNKMMYQLGLAVAALMGSLANKGFSPNDGSTAPATALNNLISVLSNLMTTADMAPFALLNSPIFTGIPRAPNPAVGDNSTQVATTAFVAALLALGFQLVVTGTSGYLKFPTVLGGLTIQWAQGPPNPPIGETFFSMVFPTPFATACFNVQTQLQFVAGTGDTDADYQVTSFSRTQVNLFLNEYSNGRGATTTCFILAIGY